MDEHRATLIKQFQNVQFDKLPEILSLNEWFDQGQAESTWVAGVYNITDGRSFLESPSHSIFLENFTQEEDVLLLNNKALSRLSGSLQPGDKVAVQFRSGKTSKVLLLSVNISTHFGKLFDHKKKWVIEKKWINFLKKVELFFSEKNFYEAKTPNLVICPGLEPSLNPFQIHFKFGALDKKLFLPTSPELHLKKILAEGASEVFEITPCFRNEEVGFQHQPEFTMLEWYRSYKSLSSIQDDVKKLIEYVNPEKVGLKYETHSIRGLFKSYLNFNLEPNTTQEQLYELAMKYNLRVEKTDSWDDIFFMLFISEIEKNLGQDSIDFVFDYPPSQAALAKINSQGWADRFEVYWQGYEIANAFNELTCPETQIKRFKKDQLERLRLNKIQVPIDENFIEALRYGLPPSAGIAMGLERLFMASNDILNINEAKHFPIGS